jgi:hypothetical protein
MGFVYLINIERTDLYKIGITRKTVEERIKSLQTGNPLKLTLVEKYESKIYQKIESVIHRMLKHKKYISEDFDTLKGEWFKLTFDEVLGFKKMCNQIEESINYLKEHSTLNATKFL